MEIAQKTSFNDLVRQISSSRDVYMVKGLSERIVNLLREEKNVSRREFLLKVLEKGNSRFNCSNLYASYEHEIYKNLKGGNN